MIKVKVIGYDSTYIEMRYLRSKGYGIIKPMNIEHCYICSQKGTETIDIVIQDSERRMNYDK